MAVAMVTAHLGQGFFMTGIILDATNGIAVAGGFEFTLTLTVASLGLAFIGPGAYALDRVTGIAPSFAAQQ